MIRAKFSKEKRKRSGQPMRWFSCSSVCSVLCLVTQLGPTLCNPKEDCSPPAFLVQKHSLGKNAGVGCHALLQGIFPTQELNPVLLYCRKILYPPRHQRSHKWHSVTGEVMGPVLKSAVLQEVSFDSQTQKTLANVGQKCWEKFTGIQWLCVPELYYK